MNLGPLSYRDFRETGPSPVTSLLHQDFSKSGLKGKKQKQKQKMAGYAPEWNHRMPMTFPRFLDIEKLSKIRRH